MCGVLSERIWKETDVKNVWWHFPEYGYDIIILFPWGEKGDEINWQSNITIGLIWDILWLASRIFFVVPLQFFIPRITKSGHQTPWQPHHKRERSAQVIEPCDRINSKWSAYRCYTGLSAGFCSRITALRLRKERENHTCVKHLEEDVETTWISFETKKSNATNQKTHVCGEISCSQHSISHHLSKPFHVECLCSI